MQVSANLLLDASARPIQPLHAPPPAVPKKDGCSSRIRTTTTKQVEENKIEETRLKKQLEENRLERKGNCDVDPGSFR
jgi:hypothetical protein